MATYKYRVKQRPLRFTRKQVTIILGFLMLAVLYYNLIFLGPVPERPEGFDIIFTYGHGPGNTLDTRDNTYSARLVDPQQTITLTLTDRELNQIWATIQKHQFYELTPQNPARAASVSPSQKYSLTVIAEGYPTTKISMAKIGSQTVSEYRFFRITSKIQNIIENKPAYKKLPEPRGGYA